jgi:hypothetical protein
MSTGALLTHGVSGFPCTGVPGDWQDQRRGEPYENVSDPIASYMNAQNHIGVPLSNFNEPWTGGVLAMLNYNAQPYRVPFVGPLDAPPGPQKDYDVVAEVNYPSHLGVNGPQELPNARIHNDVNLPTIYRQNLTWENGIVNGDNKVFMPPGNFRNTPNTQNFQGGSTANGVHPNSDVAGQQTAPNTTRPDFKGGQAPFMKLPNGTTISALQPNEPPGLWELAPPPDPQVLPGEGTAPLMPTAPAWW